MAVLAVPGTTGQVPVVPPREVAPWAVFSGEYVHEYVHEARHLLGFPCH